MLDQYILRKHDLEVDDVVQFFEASTEEAFHDDALYVLELRSCSMITLESLAVYSSNNPIEFKALLWQRDQSGVSALKFEISGKY